jgi:hypothetical protein
MYSNILKFSRKFSTTKGTANPYESLKKTLQVGNEKYQYFSIQDLGDKRVGTCYFLIN